HARPTSPIGKLRRKPGWDTVKAAGREGPGVDGAASSMLMTNRNRVLVVEDDDSCREVLTDLLRDHGFDASAARNGREMDAALKAGGVDLLLLDVGLPGEDGLAICRRVTSGPGPAVVILSAANEEVDRVIGLELGADDYISKPYGERELLARVRAVL